MVASIPNDIFQFSIHAAFHAGFRDGQPQTADLTTHGTDGIGLYVDGSLMILRDKVTYAISKTGTASLASMQARLSFAMVTVYQPPFCAKIPSITLEGLDALLSSSEFGPAQGVNTFMPFKITGMFESVDFETGSIKEDIAGTVFGFVVPAWMKHISGPRIHAHFLDANEELGGSVTDFRMAEEATLTFAKCGRFHLGFPQGEEWESMKL